MQCRTEYTSRIDTLLSGMAARVEADPSAAYAPEFLACLAALRGKRLGIFQLIRDTCKFAGSRFSALDKLLREVPETDIDLPQFELLHLMAAAAGWKLCDDNVGGFFALIEGTNEEVNLVRGRSAKQPRRRRHYEPSSSPTDRTPNIMADDGEGA